MDRRAFVRATLAGTAALALAPYAEASALAFGRRRADFRFTRLRYGSGDWDVDQRMPANVLNSLVEYTTVSLDPRERVVDLGSSEVCVFCGNAIALGIRPCVCYLGNEIGLPGFDP